MELIRVALLSLERCCCRSAELLEKTQKLPKRHRYVWREREKRCSVLLYDLAAVYLYHIFHIFHKTPRAPGTGGMISSSRSTAAALQSLVDQNG